MVLLLMVSGSVYRMLLSTVRLARSQAEHIALQLNARAAVVVGNELRELSTAAGGGGAANDLLGLGPTAISYRAMRGFGYTCQTSGPGFRASAATPFSLIEIRSQAGILFCYTSRARRTPGQTPRWIARAISAELAPATCGAGEPAISLTLPAPIGTIPGAHRSASTSQWSSQHTNPMGNGGWACGHSAQARRSSRCSGHWQQPGGSASSIAMPPRWPQ